jgi:hypothetical protein
MYSSSKFKAAFAVAASLALFAANAESVPTITFDDGGAGIGSISFAGGAANPAFTSSPILIANIGGNAETPFNPGDSFTCQGCTLEFQTGSVAVQNSGTSYTWTGGGSFFTITGSVQGLCIGFTDGDGDGFCETPTGAETLLDGTFDEAHFDRVGQQWFFTGVGPDVKHELIVEHFFGVPFLPFSFGNTEIAAAGDVVITPTAGPNAFDAEIDQTDVTNQQTQAPEPASGLLLMLGLASIAAARLRRRS